MKRIVILLASMALVAAGFQVVPAAAQEAPAIPATVQIDDPLGDANGLNDQDNAYGSPAEGEGDHVTGPGGTSTDLLKVWFSNTAKDVSLHFQTNGDPSTLAYDTYFRFASNPGTGSVAANEARGCLYWIASINGAGGGYTGETGAVLEDQCNVGDGVAGTLTTAAGPEGTFINTMTFPRSYSPLLADGGKIVAPYGVSRIVYVGPLPEAGTAAVVTLDNTQRGAEYAITAEGPSVKTPPGKNDPPGKKKGCKKGKGKKRGCEGKGKKSPKPGKPSAACAPLKPATAGAEAPSVTLTDSATAEKPFVQPLTLEQRVDEGLGDALGAPGSTPAAPASVNVQVDTNSKAPVGLYATFEFPEYRDYDLWAYFPGTENEEAASSHGFQPAIETQGAPAVGPVGLDNSNTATNHGGESTATSENLVGILTPDCGGYTISAYNYLGEGGDMELKLWLGEVKYDPADTPAAEGAQAAYQAMLLLF